LSYSPITGGEGNIEFLIHLKKASQKGQIASTVSIDDVVTEAHNQLT